MRSRRRTIIITGLLAILISYIVMNPKKSDKPYFTLYIGDKAEQIEMTDDWDGTKQIILDRVQPLWDELESGESVVFYFQRVESTEPSSSMKTVAEEKFGENVEVSSSKTLTSSKWRFFCGRKTRSHEDGKNGLEYLTEYKGGTQVLMAGNFKDWESIESYFNNNILGPFEEDFSLKK